MFVLFVASDHSKILSQYDMDRPNKMHLSI